MLTKCYAKKKEFTCNFLVSKNEVILESYEGKDKMTIPLNDVFRADLFEDRLLLQLRGGEEVAITVRTGVMEKVHYIMEFVEVSRNGVTILKKAKEVNDLISGVFKYGYEILSLLRKESFPDWASCERKALRINDLLRNGNEFFNPARKSVQELLSNIRRRFVFGVKISIKLLFREALMAGKRTLREGINYVDLSSIPEEIALMHSLYIARRLNLALEEKRLMTALLSIAGKFHQAIFPLDNSVVREMNNWLLEALKLSSDPETVINNYVIKLEGNIKNYYLIK